jgi:hypothetical protein
MMLERVACNRDEQPRTERMSLHFRYRRREAGPLQQMHASISADDDRRMDIPRHDSMYARGRAAIYIPDCESGVLLPGILLAPSPNG